jgi:2-iminobutanoate/2-iminopropanoate deaminase
MSPRVSTVLRTRRVSTTATRRLSPALALVLGLSSSIATPAAAQTAAAEVPVTREYYSDERGALRGYSRAVVTTGGSTAWLAGQTTLVDAQGNSIAGNFEAQTREIFRLLGEHLTELGGSLADIVTMTVYMTDVRNADRFVEIRREHFPEGRYPSSAVIGVVGFSRPGVVIEVKATAVIGQEAGDP